MSEFQTMSSDCDTYFCSTNSCGPGKQATIEYCYDPKGKVIATHCGCGFYG